MSEETPKILGEIRLTVLEDDIVLSSDMEPAEIVFWVEMFKTMFLKGLMEDVPPEDQNS